MNKGRAIVHPTWAPQITQESTTPAKEMSRCGVERQKRGVRVRKEGSSSFQTGCAGGAVTLGLGHAVGRQFSTQVGRHQLPDAPGVVGLGQHVHELGQGRLGRHVSAGDDTASREHVAGGVEFRMNAAMATLRDVDHGDAAVSRLAKGVFEQLRGWRISAPKRREHQAP